MTDSQDNQSEMDSSVRVPADKGHPVRIFINTWVLTQDFAPYILALRERFPEIPAESNACIGYVYVDHECGISMKVECLCTIRSRKDPIAAILLLEDLVYLKLGYSALKDLTLYQFSPAQIQGFGLPVVPDWLKFYESPALISIRELYWLDSFRAHGFFDDVMAVLPGIGDDKPELIWVRLQKFFKDTDRFHGILLTEPFHEYGIHRDDTIEVQVVRKNGGIGLLAIPARVPTNEGLPKDSPATGGAP